MSSASHFETANQFLPMERIVEGDGEQRSSDLMGDSDRSVPSSGLNNAFDPDAVDFEPLLVSGTGKILSYHTTAYYEDEDASASAASNSLASMSMGTSIGTSTITPLINNIKSNGQHRISSSLSMASSTFTEGTSPSLTAAHHRLRMRLDRFSFLAIFSILVTYGSVSLVFNSEDSSGGPRTDEMKLKLRETTENLPDKSSSSSDRLSSSMMDANEMTSRELTASVVMWDPHLLDGQMSSLLQCLGRNVVDYETAMNANGKDQFDLAINDQLEEVPLSIFTPDFRHVAQMFSGNDRGAFVSIIHVDSYIENYAREEQGEFRDNLLVRQLCGIETAPRRVTEDDFELAIFILRSKFAIGVCEKPVETMRRLETIFATSTKTKTSCPREAQDWFKSCRRIMEAGREMRESFGESKLHEIKETNEFDHMLYEEIPRLFDEQAALFKRSGKGRIRR